MNALPNIEKLEKYFEIKSRNWILDAISKSDPKEKSQFEYSLKINGGKIQKKLRVINYMNSFDAEGNYEKRIGVLSKGPIKGLMKRIQRHRLPVYYALEQDNKSSKYKIYVNFYSIKSQEKLIRTARAIFGKKICLKDNYFSLIGLDLNENFRATSYKVYYLYPFSSEERKIDNVYIEKLRKFSSEDFFVISERYNSMNEVTSRKCEINLDMEKDYRDIISLLGISGKVVNEIKKINSLVDGKLKVVIKEKDNYALYFRV